MHPVLFTRAASTELIEAQGWYESEASGLGRPFRQAVDAVIERMSASPRHFPVIYKNVHRALLRRFPYALMFVIELDDTLTVIACFHGSRDPGSLAKAGVIEGDFGTGFDFVPHRGFGDLKFKVQSVTRRCHPSLGESGGNKQVTSNPVS